MQRILRERDQGLTLYAIAERLNAEGIPTAQGGRRWWPNTVRQVLGNRTARQLREEGDGSDR